MASTHDRLYLPGPVEVAPEVLAALATPMIGHRSAAFGALYERVQAGLRWALSTEQPVYLVTASATAVWEMAVRSCVRERCLHLVNGAFSSRWAKTTACNGKQADRIEVPWGRANRDLDALREALATGRYDAVALVHSETSTGVLNPLEAIAQVVAEFEDVLLLVDAVSSGTTLPIEPDRLGIDILLLGVQKALGLPPGLALCVASERAHARAETISNRGYYLDLLEFRARHARHQTPTTPAIPQIYALERQLERMRAEGLEPRYSRHAQLAERTRAWALERGFALFPESGYEAVGLTCIENTREIDVNALAGWLQQEHHMVIDRGYGKLRGKTFRIGHMGDMTLEDLEALLERIDTWLARAG
ncbi:MAG: alanine--glyoxylate aminotransferase family protein [Planctomycetota bacterium]|nr:MAG: alanine--glyoxylate aminotransferase family protein [Planctomycetota bacterium]